MNDLLLFSIVMITFGGLFFGGLHIVTDQDYKQISSDVISVEPVTGSNFKYDITFSDGQVIRAYVGEGVSDFTVHSHMIITFTRSHFFPDDWSVQSIVKAPGD